MLTIRELAEKTSVQPQEVATYFCLDSWNNETKLNTVDAIEWLLQADIDLAISERDYKLAINLTDIYNEIYCPKVDTNKKAH